MLIVLLKINPRPGKRQDTLDILRSLQLPLQVRQDCLACEVYETREGKGEILYLEQWRNKEALSRHIQSTLYLRILTAMELAAEAPEICFHEVADSRGMDLIEEIRECEGS
ncbi:MAG: antibiotic biosynthesis monooxygenase [Calditrichaceae bacterium]|nr:antibiotic biosynthesis monooxygenase [Calditrichia bacterium]NUQ43860.1 antibiotic biosynthesis monooxygenase [Calditrichaceae bacterium]